MLRPLWVQVPLTVRGCKFLYWPSISWIRSICPAMTPQRFSNRVVPHWADDGPGPSVSILPLPFERSSHVKPFCLQTTIPFCQNKGRGPTALSCLSMFTEFRSSIQESCRGIFRAAYELLDQAMTIFKMWKIEGTWIKLGNISIIIYTWEYL